MSGDLFNLSESEQAFFNTGELPPDLAAEHAASLEPIEVVKPVVADPIPETSAAPSATAHALDILRQSLAEEQRRSLELQARLNIQEEAAKPKEVIPDPDLDPLGAMMHQLAKINGTVQELQGKLMEQRQQAESQTQIQSFQSSMHALRDEFIAKQPDFPAAYNHLRDARIADMQAIGIPNDQIQQALLRDEFIIAQTATQQGKNPAQVLYEMSRRHGYQPGKNIVQPPAAKIASIKAGQEAAKGIQSAAAPSEDVTLESISGMSDRDLNRLVLDEKAWTKMSGKGNDIFGH